MTVITGNMILRYIGPIVAGLLYPLVGDGIVPDMAAILLATVAISLSNFVYYEMGRRQEEL